MAPLLFNGDFTSGWKSKGGAISNFTFSCVLQDRFTAILSYAGRDHVGKFVIKPGDHCNSGTGERAQVAAYWPASVIGTTQWYGFSFMLDNTWTSNGDWFQVWEFGWPSESIGIDKINHLWIKQAYPNKGTTSLFALSKGVWYDVLVRIKLSYGTDGIYEFLIREPGKTSYSPVHYSTGISAKSTELAHQLGPYRGASTNTQILYIADYKVGTTRADVEYTSNGTTCPPLTCTLSMATATQNLISNISASTGTLYGVDKLADSKLFYMDRVYQVTSVPSSYLGLDYIQTADNDRFNTGTEFLQFDLSQPATVYVAYDDRISPKPSWLTSSFTDTGSNVLRDGTYTYSIYSRAYPAGHVSLGGCSIPSGGAGGMYVVIVKG